ncbi:MAG TPA: hypothetical protein VET90_01040 [Candidatus Binatus sp.]|nr:hypothetical protein [Candidatus Binatus sp.]
MTDGQGPEHYVGKVTAGPTLAIDYKQTTVVAPAGKVIQYRDGVVMLDIKTNDARMTGSVTMRWNGDLYVVVGPQWGQLEVKSANGTWTGPCTAGAWGSEGQIVAGCWLTGTGAYKGFTAYFSQCCGSRCPQGRRRGGHLPGRRPEVLS